MKLLTPGEYSVIVWYIYENLLLSKWAICLFPTIISLLVMPVGSIAHKDCKIRDVKAHVTFPFSEGLSLGRGG